MKYNVKIYAISGVSVEGLPGFLKYVSTYVLFFPPQV